MNHLRGRTLDMACMILHPRPTPAHPLTPPRNTDDLIKSKTTGAEDVDENIAAYMLQAELIERQHAKLIVEPNTDAQMVSMIKDTVVGTTDAALGVIFDVQLSGEAATEPNWRYPPARRPHNNMLVGSVLKARQPKDEFELNPKDTYFLMDSFRHRNEPALMDGFKHCHHRDLINFHIR